VSSRPELGFFDSIRETTVMAGPATTRAERKFFLGRPNPAARRFRGGVFRGLTARALQGAERHLRDRKKDNATIENQKAAGRQAA
jgi:hypothetical protein